MMNRKSWMTIMVIFAITALLAGGSYALDMGAIKARMKDRLPEIKILKVNGIIGENNSGYLEYLGNEKPKADMVQAENQDRKAVYEAIAQQQGTTVPVVGKHRAAQIEQKADPGEWLQDANGRWYKK